MRQFLIFSISALIAAVLFASLTACPAKPDGDSEGVRVITSEGGDTSTGDVIDPASEGDGATDSDAEADGDSVDGAETESDSAEGGEIASGDGTQEGGESSNEGDSAATTGAMNPFPPEGELWSYDDLGKSQNEKVQVLIETDKGNIMFELYPEIAPNAVKGFLAYVDSRYYDGTYFYRVEKGFVAQGGSPVTSKEIEQLGYGYETWPDSVADKRRIVESAGKIKDEPNYARCDIGTVSLAKLVEPAKEEGGKAGYMVDSAGADFFINTANNDHLNEHFTVFGKVVAGMDVVIGLSKDDVIRSMRVIKL